MAGLIDYLGAEARKLNFFGAVALLEEHFAGKGVRDPLSAGRIVFESDPSIAFPASDIVSIAGDDERVVLRLSFMGLAGVSSPLPSYFCDHIVRHEAESAALLDFLTMFNNRIHALFYRAWKKYRLTSIAAAAGGDPLLRCVAALAGAETGAGARRTLAYAGMLAGAPRSAAALETLLSDYFGGIPVRVQEFMPHHAPLPDPMRLGENDNARLGTTAILGTTVFDRSGKFRVRIGPVLPDIFESFLPSGANHATARELVEEFLAEPLDYDLEVLLQSADLITVELGMDNARLGETAALGESSGVSEVKSMILEGRAMAG